MPLPLTAAFTVYSVADLILHFENAAATKTAQLKGQTAHPESPTQLEINTNTRILGWLRDQAENHQVTELVTETPLFEDHEAKGNPYNSLASQIQKNQIKPFVR